MTGAPRTRADRMRQSLVLGPGVGLVALGVLSLVRARSAVSWGVLVVGLVLLLAFAGFLSRRRRPGRGALGAALRGDVGP